MSAAASPTSPPSSPLKILVPIKRVPDPDTRIRVQPDGRSIDTEGVKFAMNPFDAIALEEAVRIKEKSPTVQVVAVTIGPENCSEQLQSALAMGADRALLVTTDLALDSLAVAKLLARIYAAEKPNLILMGKQAIDDDSNQTGQMLAALLGLPQATFVSKLAWQGNERLQCSRETDAGIEVIEVRLPTVVTTDLRLNEPRYISLPSILRAKKKPIERIAATDLVPDLVPRSTVLRLEVPPKRQAGIRVKSVDELATHLQPLLT